MNRTQKMTAGAASLIAVGLALGACSSGGGESGSASGAESEGAITVGLLTGDPFWPGEIEKFTEETGIKVDIEYAPHDNQKDKLATEALAGNAPDVINADQQWLGAFAAQGFLAPIELTDEQKADFLQPAIDSLSFDGKLYALPHETHAPVMIYRPSLLEAAGVDVPTTWDEMRQAAIATTDADTGVFGYVNEGKQSIDAAIQFMDKLQQAGGSVLNEDGTESTISSDATLKALNYLYDLQWTDKVSPEGATGYETNDLTNLFAEGKAVMIPDWDYAYPILADPEQSKVSDDFALALEPGDVNNKTSVWSWGWAISSTTKNADNARKFADWASSEEALTDWSVYANAPGPSKSVNEARMADPSMTADQLASFKVFSDAVENGAVVTAGANWPSVHNAVAVMVSSVLSNQATPEEAMATADAAIKALLAK